MKKFITVVLASFIFFVAHTQLKITGPWKFKTGDQSEWSQAKFNDSKWDTIQANKPYESQGFKNYDGVSWYRKSLIIPSSLKQKSAKFKGIILELGQIDDADETFVNGKLIGKTGNFAQQDGYSYSVIRRYLLDESIINWDKENIITIRVNDFMGGGGLYAGNYNLHLPTLADFVTAKVDVSPENGIFMKGEKIKYSIKIYNKAPEALLVKAHCTIRRDAYDVIDKSDKIINVAKADSSVTEYTLDNPKPGFYKVYMTCDVNSDEKLAVDSVNLGYDPTSLNCGTSRPSDFEQYWNNAKKELAAVAPRFSMRYDSSFSTKDIAVYEVEMYSLDNIRVKGWYSVPKNLDKNTKLPALLRHIGYSGNNTPVTDRPDFAVLSFNIRGHGNSKVDFDPGFPQYITYHINDKNTYVYRGAFMDCVRAVDFLCSRPEIDATRIGVYGGSQGGALSFATAALDRRIALCAPHVPFLSDFRHYFEITSFPRRFVDDFRKDHPEITWDQIYSTLDYIDIRNLAPWITVPVFMGVGLKDEICPPHINFVAFNNISSKDKQWFVCKNCGHGVTERQHKAELEWFRMKFGMKK